MFTSFFRVLFTEYTGPNVPILLTAQFLTCSFSLSRKNIEGLESDYRNYIISVLNINPVDFIKSNRKELINY